MRKILTITILFFGINFGSQCFAQEIILIRHAQVDMHVSGIMGPKKAMGFVQAYDTANIVNFNADTVLAKLPPISSKTIYTSTLYRSMATAAKLFGDSVQYISSPLFNEFGLSVVRLPLVLPFKAWSTFSRVSWLMGRKRNNAESYKEAKQRVQKCVLFLEQKSETENQVVLVSHGFLNRNIKNQLVKRGWKLRKDHGLKNLGAFVLEK